MKLAKDLLLALINATLLLLALCLFLAWQVSRTAGDVASSFAESLDPLAPVAAEIAALNTEIAALRGDLVTLKSGSGELASQTASRVERQVDLIQTRLNEMNARMDHLRDAPDRLVETAVASATDRIGQTVLTLRGCTEPES